MKKTFTLLLLLCVCSMLHAQSGGPHSEDGTEVLLSEDFSRFTEGSEAVPDEMALNDSKSEIDDAYFNQPGWKGWGVYQAGGIAYVAPGFKGKARCELATPELNNKGKMKARMRVRSASDNEDIFRIEVKDAHTSGMPLLHEYPIGKEWKEIALDVGGTAAFRLVFSSEEHAFYIDDVEVLGETLRTPALNDATQVDDAGFTASWQTVGADAYELQAYARHGVGADGLFALADMDFSRMTGTGGTEDHPVVDNQNEMVMLDEVCHDDYPGWTLWAPAYADGMVGISGTTPVSNINRCLSSPRMDLSGDDGKVTVSFRMKAPKGDRATVCLVALNDVHMVFLTMDQKETEASGEWEEKSVALTGGNANSFIEIAYSGNGILLIDNVRITQQLPAGTVRDLIFLSKTLEADSYRVEVPAVYRGDTVCYAVRAMKGLSESDRTYSDFSETGKVALPKPRLLVEGKVWEVWTWSPKDLFEGIEEKEEPTWKFVYEVRGDTVIDGRECKKLYGREREEERLLGCFYEDEEGRVYLSTGQLLYDFEMEPDEVSDFVVYGNGSWGTVVSGFLREKQTIERLGRKYEVLKAGTDHPDYLGGLWLRGVGDIGNPLLNFYEQLAGGASYYVRRCTLGDRILFESAGKPEIPVGIEDIRMPEQKRNEVYDLSGRRLNGVPHKGFYIENGKKKVR